jgi:aminoglycoside phosphotransferase (APT) family kinase protein
VTDELTPLAAGREAEVFLRPDGAVLKLMRSPEYEDRAEREAAALETLAGGHLAPRLVDVVWIDGRPGLVLERIAGTDLLTLLMRQPWLFLRAATVMGRVHAEMHQSKASSSLPQLNDSLRARIAGAHALAPELASYALGILDTLPEGDRLCHGDFHPGNIIGTWKALVVIDWGDASRGDPMADVARTELLHRLGAPPPGTPAPFVALMKIGRRLLARRYLAVYRRASPVDPNQLSRWLVVRVAARFVEGIEEEYDTLTSFLENRRRRLPVS